GQKCGVQLKIRKVSLMFCMLTVDSELAPFSSVFQRYTGSSQDPDSAAVDATQKELQCCGIYDYRDWLATPWFNHSGRGSVPHSCCNSTYHTCNGTLELPGLLYPKWCVCLVIVGSSRAPRVSLQVIDVIIPDLVGETALRVIILLSLN
uniref:Tetraspanin 37 n=1 Tax=Hucho hucho TaxID=62062 RepID=A0A4W5MF90_9TELE